MKLSREDIVNARYVNLPAFLERELKLKPYGRENSGRFYHSPFRKENIPSMHVSYVDGIWLWYDHGSAEKSGGDAISLLRKLGMTFADAVTRLIGFSGRPVTVSSCRAHSEFYERRSVKAKKAEKVNFVRSLYKRLPLLDGAVKRYFEERGLLYHPEIGCKVFVDFRDSTKYMAFPVPSPMAMTGIELREMVLSKGNSQKSLERRRNVSATA